MYTINKDDYKVFDPCFRLNCNCNDIIGAFFTFFTVEFTSCVQPLLMSLKPGWHEMSWCPLIYPLKFRTDFQVKQNEKIYGIFRMTANDDDFRQINWNIEICHESENSAFRENWNFETR